MIFSVLPNTHPQPVNAAITPTHHQLPKKSLETKIQKIIRFWQDNAKPPDPTAAPDAKPSRVNGSQSAKSDRKWTKKGEAPPLHELRHRGTKRIAG